jgi:hypothetical protein
MLKFIVGISLLSSPAVACTLTPLYGSTAGISFVMDSVFRDQRIGRELFVTDVSTSNGYVVTVTARNDAEKVCKRLTYEVSWRGDCQAHAVRFLKEESCNK